MARWRRAPPSWKHTNNNTRTCTHSQIFTRTHTMRAESLLRPPLGDEGAPVDPAAEANGAVAARSSIFLCSMRSRAFGDDGDSGAACAQGWANGCIRDNVYWRMLRQAEVICACVCVCACQAPPVHRMVSQCSICVHNSNYVHIRGWISRGYMSACLCVLSATKDTQTPPVHGDKSNGSNKKRIGLLRCVRACECACAWGNFLALDMLAPPESMCVQIRNCVLFLRVH